MSNFEIQNWGRIAYNDAWARQKQLVDKRIQDECADTLVFCEHNPVITLGRVSQREAEESNSPSATTTSVVKTNFAGPIEVINIERGGMATYHGPGQIVVYPIFKLGKGGVVQLIRNLENWIVSYLNQKGIKAGTISGKTGVWVNDERKIASIGIAARHWVSYHGLAFNLSTGPEPWKLISPCGFNSNVMTDLQKEQPNSNTAYEHVFEELKSSAAAFF